MLKTTPGHSVIPPRPILTPPSDDSALEGADAPGGVVSPDAAPGTPVTIVNAQVPASPSTPNDRRAAATIGERALGDVEPQLRLAMTRVRPVAGEAVLRQDRPHVSVELKHAAFGRIKGFVRRNKAWAHHEQNRRCSQKCKNPAH